MANDLPQRPAQPYYQPPPPWNGFAIASLVLSVALWGVGSILGVIFGHIALRQITRTGEQGRGLAIAGLVVGYVGLLLAIASILAFVAFFSMADFTFTDWPEPIDQRP